MINKTEKILDATSTLLAKHGFHGFSMKQLAKQANVAAGTVYLHFKNKEDLIQRLHNRVLENVANHMFAGLDDKMTFFEQYQLIWKNLWNYCEKNKDVLLCKEQFEQLPSEIKKIQIEAKQKLFKPLSDLFFSGKEQKILKDLDDALLSSLSIEVCVSLSKKHITGEITINAKQLEQAISASWDAISV